MHNLIGLAISAGYAVLIALATQILTKKKVLGPFGARKFLHIMISNWWIIAMIFFDNAVSASVIPVIFIILNTASRDMKLFEPMETKDTVGYGTIYYPLAMLTLAIVSFGILKKPFVGAVGMFVMGYADGFAAVIGKKFGTIRLFRDKTLEGTVVMFISSFVVTMLVSLFFSVPSPFWAAILVGLVATAAEVGSRNGFDNFSVPVLSMLCYYFAIMGT